MLVLGGCLETSEGAHVWGFETCMAWGVGALWHSRRSAYIVMACIVIVCIVMACKVMACIVVVDIVMASRRSSHTGQCFSYHSKSVEVWRERLLTEATDVLAA